MDKFFVKDCLRRIRGVGLGRDETLDVALEMLAIATSRAFECRSRDDAEMAWSPDRTTYLRGLDAFLVDIEPDEMIALAKLLMEDDHGPTRHAHQPTRHPHGNPDRGGNMGHAP
jgi:hypothetical protein